MTIFGVLKNTKICFIAYSKQISEGYKDALPYLEKAHAKNSRDKIIIACLSIAYKRLKMNDKAEEIKDLLE